MKELIKIALNYIPQLAEALRWYKQHVKRYAILTKNNKIILVLEIDEQSNITKLESLLRTLLEILK